MYEKNKNEEANRPHRRTAQAHHAVTPHAHIHIQATRPSTLAAAGGGEGGAGDGEGHLLE